MIRVFLGKIPDDPKDWSASETLVGSLAILPPPGSSAQKAKGALAYDEVVVLREPVVGGNHQGYDEDGDGEGTEEYLKKNLRWRVQLVRLFLAF